MHETSIHTDPAARQRIRWEIVVVLGATLGLSAVTSVLRLIRSALLPTPIAGQTAQLNPVRDTVPVWDVLFNLLGIAGDLFLVAVVLLLLSQPRRNPFRAIGLDLRRPGFDLSRAALIGALIGIPGLGLYLLGRSLGLTVAVAAAPEALPWWTALVLVFSAVRAGLLEEVIMLGWLFDRFRTLGVGPWATILTSAVIRGLYHAYQGVPAIIGNIVMGIAFGWAYRRWGRVMPLVIAHTLIDIVAFVGYPLAAALFPALFTAST